MNDVVLAAHKLTKRYGRRTVVDSVDMKVYAGDIYGFLGPNGAGKTTTLRMFLGLARPTHGTVEILGRSFSQVPWPVFRQVGSLVEGPGFYPHLSAAENLRIVQRLKDDRSRRGEAEIRDLLKLVGLADTGDRPAGRFSMGMKQRLGIAMALVGEPRILILDEPTNGLDPEGFREMRLLLKSLAAERGMTILLSSHLLTEVEQVATRVGIINSGRLIMEATVGELRKRGRPALEVDVSHPEAAATLLRERLRLRAIAKDIANPGVDGGLPDGKAETGGTTIVVEGGADPAVVNELLVRNDIRVSRLVARRATLEELFFSLTGEQAGGSAKAENRA